MVSHVAGKNANLPVLNNILLKVGDGVLRMMTTNLEVAVSTLVRGKMEKEGQFAVQARLLHDYVHLLPKDRIDLEVRDGVLHLSCGQQKTSFHGGKVDEFPLIPEVEKKEKYVVDTGFLSMALTQTLFAVATDETRPEISGLLLRFTPKELIVVGTDSYRLVERSIPLREGASEKQVIVPYRSLQEVLRILADDQEVVEIFWSENQLLFTCGETELVTRIIEGQYPDYQQIIPRSHQTRGVVSVQEFLNLVKTAGLFSRTGVNDIQLIFHPAQKEIVIQSSNTQLGQNRSVLKVEEMTGDENTITFNYRYLVEGLSSMKADTVALELVDDANPGIVRPNKKDEKHLYMVMPIKQ